ncbi:MAG: carbohydrate ABC transporter permease [Eisenbergiella sp.]
MASVKSVKKRRSTADIIFLTINYVLLIICCIIVLYPIYYMFIISISDGYAVLRGEVKFFPVGINFSSYKAVLESPDIPKSYLNTVIYTVVGTFINVAMTAMCAYPLSRKKFFGRNVFAFMIIFTMFFDAGMIANFMVVDQLNLTNKIWAIVLPGAINAWYMVIMRTFFQQIPEEIYESAHLDGAGDFVIFGKIVLPLSVPTIMTMVLFYAVGHWNSWFNALIYLDDKAKYPVQLIMRNIVLSGETAALSSSAASMSQDVGIVATNVKYAVVFVTMLPILLVYPFIQKYFVKGIMVGALKG